VEKSSLKEGGRLANENQQLKNKIQELQEEHARKMQMHDKAAQEKIKTII
jgi:FtsZ-binding cell division protein ZapB